MVLAVAALLFQVASASQRIGPLTATPVATSEGSTKSAASIGSATSTDSTADESALSSNLEPVTLYSINSSGTATASVNPVGLSSAQNSQSLSTVRIPESKATKPIEVIPTERMPSRRSWLLLSLTQHGAAAFDAYSTRLAIAGGATEADPLVRPFANSPGIYAAIQVAPVALDMLSRRMQRSENRAFRKTWWLPQSTSIAVSLFSGFHNLSVANHAQSSSSKP
jgi:hypothetical protein